MIRWPFKADGVLFSAIVCLVTALCAIAWLLWGPK
jgi:hypothetical protein